MPTLQRGIEAEVVDSLLSLALANEIMYNSTKISDYYSALKHSIGENEPLAQCCGFITEIHSIVLGSFSLARGNLL